MRDDSETIGLFEPLMVSEGSSERAALNDLALELATVSASFKSSLPESIASALADLIRSMNCYYSNLIEGHNTHPIDIEKALQNDYSADPEKRDLLSLFLLPHAPIIACFGYTRFWMAMGALPG